ncbi:MAG: sigma-54 dependent transcriptional regulator [Hyphomicrobiales bacterium]|uniref:sigma-54-dependent transcriptional regulator n=1 Tax=Rhabdaerophilum calidifontis TaxID=2604328 RepID=UPI00123C18D2|nr:sigma-54 dependent transcriptional regulator [Rhabdaerophilum calidifontis]MCA1952005.1 sigma-54 dependent transcriptional regulator [Hyphomicrobiales bacterium]MCA1999693.1 sigma-54 dependent transcriptional regulator [Hyphomicrobiales bacterium]
MSPEPQHFLDGRRILLVEDDPIMGESLAQRLAIEGAKVRWLSNGSEALRHFSHAAPELVICDIRLPDMSGEEVFRKLADGGASAPFLFITAFGDIDQAVRLTRAGAGDYMAKPFQMDTFLGRVKSLIRSRADETGAPVLGGTPEMLRIEAMLRRLASSPATVLLTGETGTGKEVAARFLHAVSPQARKPFIAVNCAAIPNDLLESEIFGHERGAFTGADRRHLGYAERAQDGVLFLDEIGELPDRLQAKLLRLIEERSFSRLGGEAILPLRARLLAATNRDLEQAAREGRFRADLYYRLAVVSVDLPPLRERRDDIPWLAGQFFDASLDRDRNILRGFSSLAIEAALAHDWPGNIRELRNRVERAVALAPGEWIMPADLFPQRRGDASAQADAGTLSAARDAAERRRIESALRETGGHVGATARLLGISRTTLWERMRRLGIHAAQ